MSALSSFARLSIGMTMSVPTRPVGVARVASYSSLSPAAVSAFRRPSTADKSAASPVPGDDATSSPTEQHLKQTSRHHRYSFPSMSTLSLCSVLAGWEELLKSDFLSFSIER